MTKAGLKDVHGNAVIIPPGRTFLVAQPLQKPKLGPEADVSNHGVTKPCEASDVAGHRDGKDTLSLCLLNNGRLLGHKHHTAAGTPPSKGLEPINGGERAEVIPKTPDVPEETSSGRPIDTSMLHARKRPNHECQVQQPLSKRRKDNVPE